jgi:hypothetical protein
MYEVNIVWEALPLKTAYEFHFSWELSSSEWKLTSKDPPFHNDIVSQERSASPDLLRSEGFRFASRVCFYSPSLRLAYSLSRSTYPCFKVDEPHLSPAYLKWSYSQLSLFILTPLVLQLTLLGARRNISTETIILLDDNWPTKIQICLWTWAVATLTWAKP